MTPDGGKDGGTDGSMTLGGCLDPTDQKNLALHQNMLLPDFQSCALLDPTNYLAFGTCMATKLAVSPMCGGCYAAYRSCGTAHCGLQCANTSPVCAACLASNCNAALTACGGKVPPGL
jgi:hypothetical protein